MDIVRDLTEIIDGPLISKQPELQPLEATGRLVLAHAAIEYARYGAGNEQLLQKYRSNSVGRVHAKFLRTERSYDDNDNQTALTLNFHDQLSIELGRRHFVIAHEFCNPHTDGSVYTNRATIRNNFASKEVLKATPETIASFPQRVDFDVLRGEKLAQFRAEIEEQIDHFGFILDPANITIPAAYREESGEAL